MHLSLFYNCMSLSRVKSLTLLRQQVSETCGPSYPFVFPSFPTPEQLLTTSAASVTQNVIKASYAGTVTYPCGYGELSWLFLEYLRSFSSQQSLSNGFSLLFLFTSSLSWCFLFVTSFIFFQGPNGSSIFSVHSCLTFICFASFAWKACVPYLGQKSTTSWLLSKIWSSQFSGTQTEPDIYHLK